MKRVSLDGRRILLLVALLLVAGLTADLLAQGEIQKPKEEWQKPKDVWQQPKEIQQPKGPWLSPKDLQKIEEPCRTRLAVAADALFAFDRADLTPEAEQALLSLRDELASRPGARLSIEGHTDAVGDEAYNQRLSERRARAVRDVLARQGLTAASTPVVGHGESSPVSPNTKPDGSDDPEGRAKNRRVELVFATCEKAGGG